MVYVLDGLLYSLTHWPKSLLDHSHATLTFYDHNYTRKTRPTSKTRPSSHVIDTSGGASTPSSNQQRRARSDSKKKQILEPEEGEKLIPMSTEPVSSFFKRTESVIVQNESKESSTEKSNVLFFGVEGGASLVLENPGLVGPPNPWENPGEVFSCPVNDDYPLANQPHLLKPFAKMENLFGSRPDLVTGGAACEGGGDGGEVCDGAELESDRPGRGTGKKRKLEQDQDDRYIQTCLRLLCRYDISISCVFIFDTFVSGNGGLYYL